MKIIEGNLITKDDLVFDEEVLVTGRLETKSISTRHSLEVVGSLKVGGFVNNRFEILNLDKYKIGKMRFCITLEQERSFWLMILENIEGVDGLKSIIEDEDNCWDKILAEANQVKDILLSSTLPAVIKQAIEINVGVMFGGKEK